MKQSIYPHEYYMQRCIDLAKKGLGYTYPNPLVGSIIVHDGEIIGEGWHKKAGEAHAEVNAIMNVKDKSLLASSTLYVNLEPCNHYGKTPPCSQLIVKHNIPKVVIGCVDPFEQVKGTGISTLRNAGIEVVEGVLENEAKTLNKRFFCYHQNKRPYIILKWAQSRDGFLAPPPHKRKKQAPIFLSTKEEQIKVHQWRTEEQSIAVGAQTVFDDNPSLTARWVSGKHPIRLVFDPNQRLKKHFKIFDDQAMTLHLTAELLELSPRPSAKVYLNAVADYLYQKNIQSIIVEGGRKTLTHFIENNFWDEARVFISKNNLSEGIKAPAMKNLDVRGNGLVIIQQQKFS